jgi:hypothetical protein
VWHATFTTIQSISVSAHRCLNTHTHTHTHTLLSQHLSGGTTNVAATNVATTNVAAANVAAANVCLFIASKTVQLNSGASSSPLLLCLCLCLLLHNVYCTAYTLPCHDLFHLVLSHAQEMALNGGLCCICVYVCVCCITCTALRTHYLAMTVFGGLICAQEKGLKGGPCCIRCQVAQ